MYVPPDRFTVQEHIAQQQRIAEDKIAMALQGFYNDTGLIPQEVGFSVVEVTALEDAINGKRSVIIGTVNLRAST